MPASLNRLFRFARTTLSLGGGVGRSVRLAWHVLRTEGPGGIAWRLHNARNIAEGNVDPWQHFILDGAGQKPFPVERFAQLWSGADDSLLADLHALLQNRNVLVSEAATWTLARWYARQERWQEVLDVLQPAVNFHQNQLTKLPQGIRLLWADALGRSGRFAKGLDFIASVETMADLDWRADIQLAKANLLHAEHVAQAAPATPLPADWLQTVNIVFERGNLARILPRDASAGVALDNLDTEPCAQHADGPLVSVIVPAYNAAATLPTVLSSLTRQSWRALEILVVDDCSSDDTAAIAQAFAERDARIRLIALPTNQGAYHTRNAGMAQARGEFITVHDSDDWSHPQKIEKQVLALVHQPDRLISFSHWNRATPELVFGGWQSPENWNAWVHRNVSSLMLRRSVFERLGYWDAVRCSADTEYYYRALRVFGAEAITEVLPGIPLSFGRTAASSLTQQSETSIFTMFGGLRKQYHDAFHAWHQECDPNDVRSLYLEQHPASRPFPVQPGMLTRPRLRSQ